jgi:hypothetical protein
MKLSVCQSIFAPNKTLLEKNIRSIDSLKNIKNCEFYFSGYALPEYWDILDYHINKLNPVKYLKQDKNYGKAYNINLISKDLDCDMLLTMDSDIVFLDQDYYSIIESIYNNVENIGVISFNQLEANCHLFPHLTSEKIINGHKYLYNDSASAIAGGCVLVDYNFWKSINGYRVMGVYAGDDAYLFLDAKRMGKFYALNTDVSVIHPFETDDEYQKWKIKVCQRDTRGIEREDLTDQINESIEFWRNK